MSLVRSDCRKKFSNLPLTPALSPLSRGERETIEAFSGVYARGTAERVCSGRRSRTQRFLRTTQFALRMAHG
jgi:hypothetical protein